MSQSCIYYFSGTGNSFAVARQLSNALAIPLAPMAAGAPPAETESESPCIGFVFPCYYGTLPRIVRNFVDRLTIQPDAYCFAVVTMGGMGGGTITVLKEALENKGVTLAYGAAIRMPRNYVLEYNPQKKESAGKLASKAEKRVSTIAEDIKRRAHNRTARFKFTANKLYTNIEKLDEAFHTDAGCTSCGQCERICPVQNIKLINGKPTWQHRCEHCVACIQWCPEAAIQYGEKTSKRRRYHHPDVKPGDMTLSR